MLKNRVDIAFQSVWNQFRDHKKTEGFKLSTVFDIYLPFWSCKQNIIIERDVELDRFSRVILELVKSNMTKHSEIWDFLGVDEDSFVVVQFHFLLKNDLLRELGDGEYEITHFGISFLQNKTKPKNNEPIEFEYLMTEKLDYLNNDLNLSFFNPNFPIDTALSQIKRKRFSGYRIMQTNRITKTDKFKEIPHRHKPSFSFIRENRTNFSSFFNQQFKDKNFYDFADDNLEVHRRSICFYGLLYTNEDNQDDIILEIRQSKNTVNDFSSSELEVTLSKQTTKYIKENPGWNLS